MQYTSFNSTGQIGPRVNTKGMASPCQQLQHEILLLGQYLDNPSLPGPMFMHNKVIMRYYGLDLIRAAKYSGRCKIHHIRNAAV